MGDYPPNPSYGAPYGEQNNNYMPYDQQVDHLGNRRALSNTYPPLPPPNGAESFAAYNMANAQFNANMPPAFGSMPFPPMPFGAANNMPSGAPAYQMPAWNTPAGFPPNPMNWQQPAFNFAQNPPNQQFGLPRLDTNSQPQLNMSTQPVEEGELSEGEFDNNPQGRQRRVEDSSNNMREYAAHQNRRTNPNGYQYNNGSPRETTYNDGNGNLGGSRAGQSFQGRRQSLSSGPRRQSPTESKAEGRRNRRRGRGGFNQRSDSPRPAGDSYRPAEQPRANMNGSISSRPPTGNRASPAPLKPVNTAQADGLHEILDDDRYSPQLNEEPVASPDLRTLAQHAILNLLPAKVQFQDFIAEGINEDVVGELYDGLGLSRTPPKPVQGAASPKATTANGTNPGGQPKSVAKPPAAQSSQPRSSSADLHKRKSTNGDSLKSGQPSASKKETLQKSVSSPTDTALIRGPGAGASTPTVANGEERKDKIARLLAEKQKKQASATSPTADSNTQAALSQAAAKAEKDRLLNLKLENLRKSREARTMKTDAANKASSSAAANDLKSAQTTPVSPFPSSPQMPRQSPQTQPQQLTQVQAGSARVSPSTSSPHAQSSLVSPRPTVGGFVPPSVSLPPKPVFVAQQSPPAIPGLFLSAAVPSAPAPAPTTVANTTPATTTPAITTPVNTTTANKTPVNTTAATAFIPPSNGLQRKRPVAADFDEPVPSSSYKRPFGQSRNDTPLVIDVSEDESDDDDDDDAMDLDQPDSGQDSAGPTTKAGANTRAKAPSAERGTRQTTVQPNGPPQQTPPAAKPSPDVLQSKLDQIAQLHKKIAEAEAKKKAKEASGNRSGSQTPLAAEVASAQQKMVSDAIAEKNKASAELERLLEGADERGAASESQAMADAKAKAEQEVLDAKAKEEQEASENKKRDLERKRKRRSEIQEGLPVVDAEVEKNQQKLDDLRAEMEKAQAAIQKALEDKQKLEAEMANLGDEVEEQLPTEQTLAVRSTPGRIATPNQASDPVEKNSAPEPNASAISSKPSLPLQNGISQDKQAKSPDIMEHSMPQDIEMADVDLPLHEQNGAMEETLASQAQNKPSPLATEEGELAVNRADTLAPFISQSDRQDSISGDVSQQATDNFAPAQSPHSVSADQMLEATLQASALAVTESQTNQIPVDGDEQDTPDVDELQRAASTNSDVTRDGTRDVSMRELSVQESAVREEAVNENSEAYEPFMNEEGGAEDDTDPYEPPEATPPVAGDELISPSSPPFSPAPPEIASLHVPESSSDGGSEIVSANPETVDSIEPLGSSAQNVEAQVFGGETRSSEHQNTKFFTPYESPLKPFPSYRFSKNFTAEVPGGFSSLSYSHQIDPMKEFCRFELAGGACNDNHCEFQHFKNIVLPDDMILLQLGDSETFSKEPDTKDAFVAGLRGVLQDLKSRKIRDFPTIALEIATFRGNFNAQLLAI